MKVEINGVEKWAQEFAEAKTEPMSKEDAKVFIKTCFVADQLDNDKEVIERLSDKQNASWATVFWLRVKKFGVTYEITPTVAILAEFFIHNFGESTMLVAYMQYVAHLYNIKKFTHEEFCRWVVPFGAPTEEEYQRLWKLQKIDIEDRKKYNLGVDNGLDYPKLYESLIKK